MAKGAKGKEMEPPLTVESIPTYQSTNQP